MSDNDRIIDDDLAMEVIGVVDSLLYQASSRVRLLEPSNRARLMAHIEDRVREEVERLIGEHRGT